MKGRLYCRFAYNATKKLFYRLYASHTKISKDSTEAFVNKFQIKHFPQITRNVEDAKGKDRSFSAENLPLDENFPFISSKHESHLPKQEKTFASPSGKSKENNIASEIFVYGEKKRGRKSTKTEEAVNRPNGDSAKREEVKGAKESEKKGAKKDGLGSEKSSINSTVKKEKDYLATGKTKDSQRLNEKFVTPLKDNRRNSKSGKETDDVLSEIFVSGATSSKKSASSASSGSEGKSVYGEKAAKRKARKHDDDDEEYDPYDVVKVPDSDDDDDDERQNAKRVEPPAKRGKVDSVEKLKRLVVGPSDIKRSVERNDENSLYGSYVLYVCGYDPMSGSAKAKLRKIRRVVRNVFTPCGECKFVWGVVVGCEDVAETESVCRVSQFLEPSKMSDVLLNRVVKKYLDSELMR